MVLLPASAQAHAPRSRQERSSSHRQSQHSARQNARRNPVTVATAVAERYWRATPCGGKIAVSAYATLAPGLDSTTDGWATFISALGLNNPDAPASTYSHCTISLARWDWPTRKSIEADWGMFCLTVIHEMGHLLGHPHSATPGSVMAPVFTDESNVPPICRATSPREELQAHARGPNH
jgi:Matrixin